MNSKVSSAGGSSKPSALDKKFQSLGLITDLDLVFHLPIRYEDLSRITPAARVQVGIHAQLEGVIEDVDQQYRSGRKQLTATFRDGSGTLRLRWLHVYPGQAEQLSKKSFVRVRGEIRGGLQWGFEIIHPRISAAGAPLPDSLQPIYPSTQGLQQHSIRKRVQAALRKVRLTEILDARYLPASISWTLQDAVDYLHNPPNDASEIDLSERCHPAWERIKFDEILAQQLAMSLARARREQLRAYPITTEKHPVFDHVMQQFGSKLTAAQQRTLEEIRRDLLQNHPMHRLLQGDVGCGKTIVAALSAALVLDLGLQVAVMAPTEILAGQLFRKFESWLSGSGLQPEWLASSVKAGRKRQIVQGLEEGSVKLVVGTQALIQKNIQFSELGLAIVDEQHRFGVGQRLELSCRGEKRHEPGKFAAVPHQLTMSATPIPRTLAMTFFSDMDVSVIDEFPPGKKTVRTKLINAARRDEVVQAVDRYAQTGQQVYWVCPLVEESEALQLETAIHTHAYLQEALHSYSVGLMHGKLSAEEKQAVMDAFRQGQIQILVATTVIEVGVDVPQANLIVIEHSERFGLAQLHQLRGRVGRGQQAATCILLYQSPLSQQARERLRAMYETADGFEIARRDLAQRGPGEFLGIRQSGSQLMRFADFQKDAELVEHARSVVPDLLKSCPKEVEEFIDRWVLIDQDYLRS